LLAIGGSTNAIVHLTAIAGRMGIAISLDRLNAISDETPVLIDLKPTGDHYMEDLFFGGGVGAVLREIKPLLHLDCMTVAGETLGERLAREDGAWADPNVVRPTKNPMRDSGGLVALFGNLAPNGAILKRSAADPALFESEGRAVVFSSLEDMAERGDRDDLDVNPGDFLVLQNAGPKAIGMPEAGYLPIPAKLARQGVKDMVRLSDARMSGTAFGTIVLHISPEAAIGGPLALVRNGDRIRISVAKRRIELLVDDAELARRKSAWKPFTALDNRRGYGKLYFDHVLQAEHGCDFDFLRAVR
jgi:dihydroxy-acid dehydratase